ncbi:hypothetical protein L249_4379 [Ophiocordyceps polyrhachis-furcata BCC 54312]|uniref:Uncharacterized protein n=1 Tax=Ophiocordyceps polyrhachis-furcata BCC 54312 TaxID=1330021 RepID=A0A367L7G0_9HYPO|nr:hypothetical protein L249_4379 [Ophiocordyceps polyrhachis-furcata BCC 54312]
MAPKSIDAFKKRPFWRRQSETHRNEYQRGPNCKTCNNAIGRRGCVSDDPRLRVHLVEVAYATAQDTVRGLDGFLRLDLSGREPIAYTFWPYHWWDYTSHSNAAPLQI